MNLELFITKRIAKAPGKSFSKFIVNIAIVAVALSLAVMIVATSMVRGFQQEISNKVFGFWGHIHISKFNLERVYEELPIDYSLSFYDSLKQIPQVSHVQVYANKAGIIKTADNIEGVVLKGIGQDFDWDFFGKHIKKGGPIEFDDSLRSNEIIISDYTAKRLNLDIDSSFATYFIQQPPRVRKFTVAGIYNTGLEEFDKVYALVDIRHIQRLNDWSETQAGGIELFIDDIGLLEPLNEYIYYSLPPDLYTETIKQKLPNIFDWLQLQSTNEVVILVLMCLVAAINMVSVLLILILERTNMIGILKAFGADNWSIRKIFIYNAAYIVGKGLFWGNAAGILIVLAQKHFKIIRLPEESYYVSVAPVEMSLSVIALLNGATLLLCLAAIIGPTYLVSKITPVKAIRFS